MKINTNEERAKNWLLWQEFVDPDGTMTKEEFDRLSIQDKIEIQVEIWGENQDEK